MSFQFLLLVFIGFNLGTRAYAAKDFSSDCKHWVSTTPESPSVAGYFKDKAGYLYFDLSKKIWMSLDQKPKVFVLRENEVLIVTPESVEVFSYTSKHPDKFVELLAISPELAKKLAEESRWVFRRMKKGETFLAGLFAMHKSCTAAPNARGIMCIKNRPCSLVPSFKATGNPASSCMKELGLLEPTSIKRLDRACALIGDGSTYSGLLQAYAKAKTECSATAPDLTSLQDIKRACEEGRSILSALK